MHPQEDIRMADELLRLPCADVELCACDLNFVQACKRDMGFAVCLAASYQKDMKLA